MHFGFFCNFIRFEAYCSNAGFSQPQVVLSIIFYRLPSAFFWSSRLCHSNRKIRYLLRRRQRFAEREVVLFIHNNGKNSFPFLELERRQLAGYCSIHTFYYR